MNQSFYISLISCSVALISIAISGFTLWLTFLRKGRIRTTRPNIVAFGFDKPQGPPKVFLRTLLFNTAHRGHVLDSLFVEVRRSETIQTFTDWAYGDAKIVMGSGLHIPREGISCNHYFLASGNFSEFVFLPGEYIIRIYAAIFNRKAPVLLDQLNIFLNEEEASILKSRSSNVIFTWNPDSKKYIPSKGPSIPLPVS
jgi:hypothetical protein